MFLETIETEGLAHLSYLIGDSHAGVGAVIDPRRDVDVYLELAQRHEVRITHVLETHVHADFASGSRELAERTGAALLLPADGGYDFPHEALVDGGEVEIGGVRLRVLHTPGHTPEHVCFLVGGGVGAAAPWGVFTGDTLFAGEVGRPDLLGEERSAPLARQLHQSIFERLLPLGDGIEIYPAHGKGSPCGASIGDRKTSTLGYERLHNPRLRDDDVDAFVRELLESAPAVPFYYRRMKRLNVEGAPALGALPALPALAPERFAAELREPNTVVVDAREIEAWGGAHIGGSLNIALRKAFPIWAGWLLRPEQRILLVLGDPAHLDAALRHLLRVGFDNVVGYLRQGMRSWIEAGLDFRDTPQIGVHELKWRIERGGDELQVLDVRSEAEWRQGHIPGARHVFAPYLADELDTLDRDRTVAVYCGSGYRASMAASVLKRAGFEDVRNVPGSMSAWQSAGYPLSRPASRAG